MLKAIRTYPLAFVVLLVLLVVFFGSNFANLYTDYLWFVEVHHKSVFLHVYGTRILLFGVFGFASFLLAYINVRLAGRFSPASGFTSGGKGRPVYSDANGKTIGRGLQLLSGFRTVLDALYLGGALFFAGIAGLTAQTQWDSFLRYTNPVSFGILDPQFGP